MTKAELISRIVDSFHDMSGECPFDYEDLPELKIEESAMYLREHRAFEDSAELDQDERLPVEVTPALYMEAYNCYIRMMKHECTVLRLAKYVTDNCMVCEYENYYGHDDGTPEIFPTDFLYNAYRIDSIPFNADHPIDIASLIRMGQNSSEFNMDYDEFCYYDKKHNALVGVNNPFQEGLYDARAFAEFMLSDEGQDCLDYIFNEIMDEDDHADVFRTDLFKFYKEVSK